MTHDFLLSSRLQNSIFRVNCFGPFFTMQSAKIFAGTSSQLLAEQICKRYGTHLGRINIQRFSDGEISPIFLASVRGDYIFLVQSTYSPAANLMELLLMIDAARRAS